MFLQFVLPISLVIITFFIIRNNSIQRKMESIKIIKFIIPILVAVFIGIIIHNLIDEFKWTYLPLIAILLFNIFQYVDKNYELKKPAQQ